MSTSLKALVATTCLFVIGATGWWMIDQYQVRAAAAAASDEARQAASDGRLEECRLTLREYEAGNEEFARRRYGNSLDAAISLCRTLVQLDEIRPSN